MPARARNDPGARASSVLLVIAVLAATLGAIGAAELNALRGLSNEAHDALIRERNGDRPAPTSVVLFAVDSPTLSAQEPPRLPLDRTVYARAIERLTELGARAIAVDVQFTEASGDDDADLALFDAVDAAEVPVILGTSEVLDNGDTAVLGGRESLESIGAVAGHSSLPHDEDRYVRRLDPQIDGIPSIAQATAQALGRPGLPRPGTLLDPAVPGDRLSTFPLQALLDDQAVDPAAVRGRVAVIGVTVVGSEGDDLQQITGSADRVFGVQAQAQAIDTALRGEPLRDATRTWPYVLAALMGLIAVLGGRRALWIQLLSAVAALAGLVAISLVAVRSGWLVDPVPAIVALIVASLGAMAVRAETERRRRTAARATLGRFVPPGVVDELLDDHADGRIAPRAQGATVMFCDLRGYTALVASLRDPQALIAILDAYLSAVTETVHRYGGTVVSFQGDGVMSAFGTPVATAEAPRQAVAAARDLQLIALPKLREDLRSVFEHDTELRLGVGVATAAVFAGTVGPPERREYAVVGPATNLAARLQALTKTEGVDVILDVTTAAGAGADVEGRVDSGLARGDGAADATGPALRRIGLREIRGLERPIDVWTLDHAPRPVPDA